MGQITIRNLTNEQYGQIVSEINQKFRGTNVMATLQIDKIIIKGDDADDNRGEIVKTILKSPLKIGRDKINYVSAIQSVMASELNKSKIEAAGSNFKRKF